MNIFEKGEFLDTLLMEGIEAQLKQRWTWVAATSIGFRQMLKHRFSVRTGMVSGLTVLMVLSLSNGLYNVFSQREEVKVTFLSDEKAK